ncbi:MAG: ATP-binding protein, partial [Candidatus Heimdallarchaeaceae archaeon]
GMYVIVPSEEGAVVAMVTNVLKTNRYFSSPSAVKAYESSGKSLTSIFPADRWEYVIAIARPLGLKTDSGIKRLLSPVSPGDTVYLPDDEELTTFLGLDYENGLEIGSIPTHDLLVKLNMTRLLQKHVALLAISGAGKSYTTSVLIEELLSRTPEQGRVALVLFDVHGEYTGFTHESSPFHDQVEVFQGAFIQFATHQLSAEQFALFQPQMSTVQTRELHRILGELYSERIKQGESYSIQDIIAKIEQSETMNSRSKEALIGWMYTLESTRLFGYKEAPLLEDKVKPGKLLIIDLSDFTSLRKKQMIVAYMLYQLFELRKKNKIAPTTIILEESHQFAPESSLALGLSRPIIETIAREGRKFFISLCLISQRPVKLSTTALSQCNSQIIMRILNPYDLDFIGRSSEGIDRETLNAITTLGVGEAFIVGNAVNHPIFVKIRSRMTKTLSKPDLEEVAKSYEA